MKLGNITPESKKSAERPKIGPTSNALSTAGSPRAKANPPPATEPKDAAKAAARAVAKAAAKAEAKAEAKERAKPVAKQ